MKKQEHTLRSNGAPTEKVWLGTSLVAALGASLCCITPLVALVAGTTSSLGTSISWLEPLRPYLIGLTTLVLAYAWYQKLRASKQIDCDCKTNLESNFMHSKTFLFLVTLFAAAMLAFPSYAHIFYPQPQGQQITADKSNVQIVEIKIKGMTCAGCEGHVNSEVNKLAGILKVETSYANGNTLVKFDKSKTDVKQIEKAVGATGYKVTQVNLK